jgi:diguanylate cyclase (GGDEF)-like protein
VPYLMLIVAVVAGLLSDTAYSLLMLAGQYRLGDPIDVGWLAMRVALGAAALHPGITAMAVVTTPESSGVVGNGRFAALAVASLTAPAALTIQWIRQAPLDVPVFASGAVVLFLLVIARLRGVVATLSRTLRTVESQANTDQLTGLANRRQFHRRWEWELGRGAGRTALLYVDLDGFKPVNDALGHDAGDAVLVAVAARLRGIVRAEDLVARLGGDEFAVILTGTDDDGAYAVARRIVEALAEPFLLDGVPVTVGASVGVVAARRGDDPEVQLRRADGAMYDAKAAGRGRVSVAVPATTLAAAPTRSLSGNGPR